MLHVQDKTFHHKYEALGWKRCKNCHSDYYGKFWCHTEPEPIARIVEIKRVKKEPAVPTEFNGDAVDKIWQEYKYKVQ